MVEDLRSTTEVKLFMETPKFLAGNLIVDATLCDHHLGFHAFIRYEVRLEANTCNNHHLSIGAANNTHCKCFRSQKNMDNCFDRGVRMSNIGMEAVRRRADVLLEKELVQDLEDPDAYAWWDRTRSLKSCHCLW